MFAASSAQWLVAPGLAAALALTPAAPPPGTAAATLVPVPAGLALPLVPDFAADALAAVSPIGSAIETAYLALEQWVQYGVNLTSWAAGWVPFVGLLAPQINFFYTLGESVVQSSLFNTIGVLDGSISLAQGLSNFGAETAAAFNTFIQTQISWIAHFFPPFPPIGALEAVAGISDVTVAGSGLDAPDPGALNLGDLFDTGAEPNAFADLGDDLVGGSLGLLP